MYRFEGHTFDSSTGELRGPRGARRLQPKPGQLLEMLLDAGGGLVGRDEVRERLWPDVAVDFDSSLNTCVRQIRMALAATGGSGDRLETLRKRGYRLTVRVEGCAPTAGSPRVRVARTRMLLVGAAVFALAAATTVWRLGGPSPSTTSLQTGDDAGRAVRLAVVPFIDPLSDASAVFNRELTEAFVVALTDVAPADLIVIGPSTTAVLFTGEASLASVAVTVGADFVLHGGHRSRSDIFFVEVVRAGGEHLYATRMPLDLRAAAEAPLDVVTAIARAVLDAAP